MKEKVRYYLEELQMSPEQIVGYCKSMAINILQPMADAGLPQAISFLGAWIE